MSEKSPFARFDHIGVVVKDIHKTVEHYESLGLGPFIEHHHGNDSFKEKKMWGKPIPIDGFGLERRLGRVAQTRAEVLQPAWGEGPWMEFLKTKGEGIHHLAFTVDDIDWAEDWVVKKGLTVMFSTRYYEPGGAIYVDTRKVGGFVTELTQWAPGMDVDLPESPDKVSFSNMHHVGVMIKDMDTAIKYYESVGMGPFKPFAELRGTIVEETQYGKPAPFEVKNMMLEVGSTELELIQPVKNSLIHGGFIEKRGEGINHVAFIIDDLDENIAKFEKKGFKVILTRRRIGGVSAAYIDFSEIGGVIAEFIEMPKD
ncbi:VOC family protein [Chloroflexota bacterium]